jgi:ATP-dependent exoDNAse (exonuclease V) beta subunit
MTTDTTDTTMTCSGVGKTPPTYLANLNRHPRDEFITFEEGPHIYTVHGEQGYTSVTTLNHRHFSDFDADKIIDKMMKSRNWREPTYKYYGMTREQIKTMWDTKRDSASFAGTNMHYDIECYFNKIDNQNDSIEFQYFKRFVSDFPDLKPYRTEWMVYYEELKLSGSIDMIFENSDGTLQIYDWKRCQEIKYESFGGQCAVTPCISHLPDTNFWHYSLQLNTYKTILEHKYGKKINGMYLICLHPDNPYKTYERIEVPVLEKEMADLFELRKKEVLEKLH